MANGKYLAKSPNNLVMLRFGNSVIFELRIIVKLTNRRIVKRNHYRFPVCPYPLSLPLSNQGPF